MCDLRWSCPLQPLQSHCHHCITAGHQPARNGQAHDPHFPKDLPPRHQLKNNFATLCNSFAKPPPLDFFGTKSTHCPGRTSQAVRGRREREGKVGKNSWQASQILVQLARPAPTGGVDKAATTAGKRQKSLRLAPRFGSKQSRSRHDLGVKALGD